MSYTSDRGFTEGDSFRSVVEDDRGDSSAAIAVTGTTSNVVIPAALFGAGLLLIAFGVRLARNEVDEPFEQS